MSRGYASIKYIFLGGVCLNSIRFEWYCDSLAMRTKTFAMRILWQKWVEVWFAYFESSNLVALRSQHVVNKSRNDLHSDHAEVDRKASFWSRRTSGTWTVWNAADNPVRPEGQSLERQRLHEMGFPEYEAGSPTLLQQEMSETAPLGPGCWCLVVRRLIWINGGWSLTGCINQHVSSAVSLQKITVGIETLFKHLDSIILISILNSCILSSVSYAWSSQILLPTQS